MTVNIATKHVSYSEIAALNRCERLWDYSYRRLLTPLREDARLGRGTIMHKLLSTHYKGDDWEAPWVEMRRSAAEDALLPEETEQIEKDFDLYGSVMRRYVARYPLINERVLAVETPILVPILGGVLKIVPDVIVETNTGQRVRDFKTVTDFDKDMELRADFDPQLSFYAWGLRKSGYPSIEPEFDFIRMRVPAVPKINKDGTMSKVYVITDETTVREFVATSGVKIAPEDLEAYIARLPQEDQFFKRVTTFRTDEELEAIAREIVAKTEKRNTLLQQGTTTRTLIRDCVFCPFFRPCIAALKNGDEEALLAEFYHARTEDEDAAMPVDFEEEAL